MADAALRSSAGLPSGTVTFLFTDIEGSIDRWERHAEAMSAALARHDALLRAAIRQHAGHVVKTMGDAFHARAGYCQTRGGRRTRAARRVTVITGSYGAGW